MPFRNNTKINWSFVDLLVFKAFRLLNQGKDKQEA